MFFKNNDLLSVSCTYAGASAKLGFAIHDTTRKAQPCRHNDVGKPTPND